MFAEDTIESYCVLDTGLNFPLIPYRFRVAENFGGLVLIIACHGFVIEEVMVNQVQFIIDRRCSKPGIEDNINRHPVVIGIRECLAFTDYPLRPVWLCGILSSFQVMSALRSRVSPQRGGRPRGRSITRDGREREAFYQINGTRR